MTRMEPAHPLVQAQWPHIAEVPAYDLQLRSEDYHLGAYIRRVAGDGWWALAGLVNHVVVAPAARGQGLGRWMVEVTLGRLSDLRVPFAHVHCAADGMGFYAALGFAPAPNFPAPTHHGERVSMVAVVEDAEWPDGPVEYVEPW